MHGFLHASMVQALEPPVPARLYCLCLPVVYKGVWGLLLTQGWRGRHQALLPALSLLVGAMLVPQTWLCIEITAWLCLPVRLPSLILLKEIPTCPCDAGGRVGVCIDENHGFVSLIWFFCNSHELVDLLSKLREDTFLLRSLRVTIAIPHPWCLWMTVKPWNASSRFGHILFACRHTTSVIDYLFQDSSLSVGMCTIQWAYSEVPLGQPVCFSHFTPLAAVSWSAFSASLPLFPQDLVFLLVYMPGFVIWGK